MLFYKAQSRLDFELTKSRCRLKYGIFIVQARPWHDGLHQNKAYLEQWVFNLSDYAALIRELYKSLPGHPSLAWQTLNTRLDLALDPQWHKETNYLQCLQLSTRQAMPWIPIQCTNMTMMTCYKKWTSMHIHESHTTPCHGHIEMYQ